MRLALAALLCFGSTALAASPRDPIADRIARVGDALVRDAGGPRAAADLAELASLQPEAPDLARLATLYGRIAEDGSALPEVRAMARAQLAGVERSRGNLQRQGLQLRKLGYVADWRVIGPFDDEGKRGLETVQPPEKAIELDAVYPGKGSDATWRTVPPELVEDGFVHVGGLLPREKEVCAHALAVVDAPRDDRLALWFGASGAARVLVNGALAIEDRGYHPARPDQRGAQVSLQRGANRIQVKLCNQEGRMGFFLRLVDGRGVGVATASPPSREAPRRGDPSGPTNDLSHAPAGAVSRKSRAKKSPSFVRTTAKPPPARFPA
jgi:hypothetical protein